MKSMIHLGIGVVLVALMAGCGSPSGNSGVPAGGPKIDPPAELLGSTWLFDDTRVEFRADGKAMVTGGIVADAAPDGLLCDYTIKDGIVEISGMDETKAGTWGDGKLVVDGIEGQVIAVQKTE